MDFKKSFLVTALGLFVAYLGFSQRSVQPQHHELNWQGIQNEYINDEESKSYLYFKEAQLGRDALPYYIEQFELRQYNDLTVELQNVVTQPLSSDEAEVLKGVRIGSDFEIQTSSGVQRKQNMGFVAVLPFRKTEGGAIEKLISFDLQVDYQFKSGGQSVGNRSNRSFATSSVLASGSGQWYKIGVVGTAIFKVDYDFLQSIGVNVSGLNANYVHVFGNSAGMLPVNNSVYRPDDLLEVAIKMNAGANNVMDPGDYFLFYAKGPDNIGLNGQLFTHTNNVYSDTSYYFININSTRAPKRIQSVSSDAGSPTHTVTSFGDYGFIEKDDRNMVKSGSEWYGDEFDILTTRTYSFNFPNITSDPVTVFVDAIAYHPVSNSTFTVTETGTGTSQNITIADVGTGQYAAAANPGSVTMQVPNAPSSLQIKLDYNKPDASAKGWLNKIVVNARRNMVFSGTQMDFRDPNSVGPGNLVEYQLQNAGSITEIWDVTDPSNAGSIQYNMSGGTASFVRDGDELREFIAYTGNSFPAPTYHGRPAYSNLHALPQADYIIVSHPAFLSQANRLANFHRNRGLSVNVARTDAVYNEFSSGMQDAGAIRDFLRMFYTRAGNDASLMPKYLLLFGDGSYDNKHRLANNQNFVVSYQSPASLLATNSYTSDDYFVLLDSGEAMNNGDLIDVGVGRFPVKSLTEATNCVSKTIHYLTNSTSANGSHCNIDNGAATLGDWRNLIVFVADDEDSGRYPADTEGIIGQFSGNHPEYNIEKIYFDSYVQESTPGGERYFDVEEDIKNRVQLGCLVINYMGHGGEAGWAHERVLDIPTINAWTNYNSMPLFMTATCEFSRFEDPGRTSAGELVLLNPRGGGVALFTTTRLVFAGQNTTLNRNFYDYVVTEVNGEPRALGDILVLTKNASIDLGLGNHRKFSILGDPALTLAIPKHHVVTDSINGIHIAQADTLNALSKVTIKGHITDNPNGTDKTDFNGYVFPTVFDKSATLTTLSNNPTSTQITFEERKNVIYKGKASVTNGAFSFSFVVPKDIAYQIGPGRISYYAHNGEIDAHGYTESVMVGGSDPNAIVDNDGPQIELFMNNENFVNGGTTDESPSLYAKVFDENGINTVGNGIGHDIAAVLDKNTTNQIILNEFYESDLDTYQSGKVNYPFSALSEGTHTLSLKVWDVNNNSSEEEIEFVVANSEDVALEHVLNYPNPFTTNTTFFFEHNQVCENLDVKIEVYTISGKLVKSILQTVRTDGFRIDGISWDGRDDFGDQIGRGVYMYKVSVETPGGEKAHKTEKLVILK